MLDPEPPAEAVAGEELDDMPLAVRFMPEPRSAAIATMALLAFGVVVGAATGPLAQSAGISPIVVEMGSGAPPAAETAAPEVEEAPEHVAEAPAAAPQAVAPEALPEPPQEGPSHVVKPPPEEFLEEPGLPPIEHVFLIVLEDHGFEESFGKSSQLPYLSQQLAPQGELLSNYYAVTQGDLANEIALLSGQGPTAATVASCPEHTDIAATGVGLEEQVEGEGCVYPAETKTLSGQLVEAKKSWKAYAEEGGGCSQEVSLDPFAYFHSVIDRPDCAERDVDFEQLAADLKSEKTTPSLSYIVPGASLETVIPEIQESAAYKQGGLIAITFAQAPQSGPSADSSACCGTPEYPNLSPPTAAPVASGPVKPSGGGGRVGLLLLSPFVEPGTVNESGYYNHFSLLLSLEELFGLPPIGYAASPVLTPFDSSVYNLSS